MIEEVKAWKVGHRTFTDYQSALAVSAADDARGARESAAESALADGHMPIGTEVFGGKSHIVSSLWVGDFQSLVTLTPADDPDNDDKSFSVPLDEFLAYWKPLAEKA